MKKLLLSLSLFALISCSSNVNDVSGFQFDGAWYWLSEYEPNTPVEDLKAHVKTFSNPDQTSFFFFFDKSKIDISGFENESFNQNELFNTIIENKPDTAFYRLPVKVDPKIKTDAMWLIKQSLKE